MMPVETSPETVDLWVVANPLWEVSAVFPVLPNKDHVQERGAEDALSRASEVVWSTGGSASNVAVLMSRAGFSTGLSGRIGGDEPGKNAADFLSAEGVFLALEEDRERTTKTSAIFKEEGSDHGYFRIWVPPRSVLPPSDSAIPQAWLDASWLHLDRVSELGLRLAEARVGRGLPVSLDLHTCPHRPAQKDRLKRLLPCLRYLQISESASQILGEDLLASSGSRSMEELSERIPWVVVTRGNRGALCWEKGAKSFLARTPAPESSIDSTGAGDAFAAAFLGATLRGSSFEEACHGAAKAGALACGHLGPLSKVSSG